MQENVYEFLGGADQVESGSSEGPRLVSTLDRRRGGWVRCESIHLL